MDTAPEESVETSMTEPKKGPAYGSILGIILIVAVLVVGAFYVWGERLKQNDVNVTEDGVPSEGTMPRGGSMEASIQLEGEGPQPQ